MEFLITTLHVLVCLCLIVIVLLQHGKGADMGVTLGGGASNTVFGARGAGNFLTKLTTGAAVVFMLTSFVLARFGQKGDVEKILAPPPSAAAPAAPAAPGTDAPSATEGEASAPSGFETIPSPAGNEAPAASEAPSPAPAEGAPTNGGG